MARAAAREVVHLPADGNRPAIEVQRSSRRRRSATAFVREQRVVVQVPAGLPAAEEQRLITSLVDRVTRRAAGGATDDEALRGHAVRLAKAHLDGVQPTTIVWSRRMRRRYGSCTPADGSIRISAEVAAFPDYVRDYVIVHELAHLHVEDHSKAFHALVARFPRTAEAQAWLSGWEAGRARAVLPEQDEDDTAS